MIGQLFQPMHLLVVLVVALFVFGPRKLPELGKSIGKSINEFRRSMHEDDEVVVAPAKDAQQSGKTETK